MHGRILLAAACLTAATAWAGEPHETSAVTATVTVSRLGGANLAALAAVIEARSAESFRQVLPALRRKAPQD